MVMTKFNANEALYVYSISAAIPQRNDGSPVKKDGVEIMGMVMDAGQPCTNPVCGEDLHKITLPLLMFRMEDAAAIVAGFAVMAENVGADYAEAFHRSVHEIREQARKDFAAVEQEDE